MDVVVDVIDPADRDHMVFEAAGQVHLGQFDLIAQNVIDPSDVAAVGTDDFLVFLDSVGVYHETLLCGGPIENGPTQGRFHTVEVSVGDVVNLNKVRKEREKAQAKSTASANRAAHGRSKAMRETADAAKRRLKALLDGAKRED